MPALSSLTPNIACCRANFKRSHDGHVAILNRFSKQWTDVKCDLQVPGLLLLREASNQVSVKRQ
jgi:hypothetical protein